MDTPLYTATHRYLPLGKRFHLFFIFCNENEDKEWVKKVIDDIESFQYKCGYNERDYDRDLSKFSNFEKCIKDSCGIGLLISKLSIRNDTFMYELEGAIHLSHGIKDNKPRIIPLVIDSSDIPSPLLPYIPLCVSGLTNDWLHTLIRAIDVDESNPQTVSDDSDEELEGIQYHHDMLVKALRSSSIKNQKNFLRLSKFSGLSYYVGQMGPKRMQDNFMNACGVDVREKTLCIKWETFRNVLENSINSIIDLVLLNRELKVNKLSLELANNDTVSDSEELKRKMVMFSTKVLHCSSTGPPAFRVTENGFIKEHLRTDIAEFARQICLNMGTFKSYSSDYDTVEKRIQTYKKWSKHYENIITQAAKAGFIYTGVADLVVCYSCNFSLYGWAESITARFLERFLVNHYHFNKDCPYLQDLITPIIKEWEWQFRKYGLLNPSVLETLEEVTKKNRERKPLHKPLSPDDISEMGFLILAVYTPPDVLVRCFSCDVRLSGIETKQDLENKHIEWSPDCKFLNKEKGMQYIREVRKNMHFSDKKSGTSEMIIEIVGVQSMQREES